MKNMSFDDGEQMVSLIQKKKDDSAIEAFSEVGKMVGKITNVKQQGTIPSGATTTIRIATADIPAGPGGTPVQSAHAYPQVKHLTPEAAGKDGAPFAPEYISKTSGDKYMTHSVPDGVHIGHEKSATPGITYHSHTEPHNPGQFTSFQGAVVNNYVGQPQSNPVTDQTSPGVRVTKQSLRDSLGSGANLNDNSLLEYFIEEQGYLVDANGNPLLDETGQPVLLTEDNIKYLRNQNLLDE